MGGRGGVSTAAIGVLVMVLMAGLLPAAAAAEFCERGKVRDYARPLERMPALRQPPAGERLPFGPARVALREVGGPLVVGADSVGYNLTYWTRAPGQHFSALLDWQVDARLVRVSRRGLPLRRIDTAAAFIRRLRSNPKRPSTNPDFSFEVSRPGYYRVEIAFERRDGRRLARFGRFFRLLRPTVDARLTLNGTEFHPGEQVTARIENYGTDALFYGLSRGIERFDGSEWTTAPESSQGAVLLIGLWSGPGEAATCWGFRIPAGEPAGLYRFVWSGEAIRPVHRTLAPGNGTPLVRTAEFEIF